MSSDMEWPAHVVPELDERMQSERATILLPTVLSLLFENMCHVPHQVDMLNVIDYA